MTDAFRLRSWLVEPELNRISNLSGHIILEPKSMEVLVYLADRQGGVVAVDELIDNVWQGRALGDNPVYKIIAKLRRALGDNPDEPLFIETIARKGYRLICPVTPASAATNNSVVDEAAQGEKAEPKLFASRSVRLGIATAMAAVVAMAVFILNRLAPPPPTEPVSIAVLPFANFGTDDTDALLVDGVAEEILNQLAQSPELRVVARTSSFRFRNQTQNTTEIGDALGAAYLIEGSIRRDGERLRITAQLIEAESGYHLWSETFDDRQTDIFAIQDRIAQAVANALDVRVFSTRSDTLPTENLEAWNLYLQGRGLWQRKGEGPIRAAIDLFQQAVDRDPNFAVAWGAMSEAWMVLPRYAQEDLEGSVAKGKDAAEKALRLDPMLAQPYLSLAAFENQQGDFVAGHNYVKRALALEPRHTGVLNAISFDYGRAGWIEEATVYSKKGVALDPLEGGEYITLGYLQMVSGDLEDARATFLRAWNDLGVRAFFVWEGLFEIYLLSGELDEAEEWLSARPNENGVERRRALIAALRDKTGDTMKAFVAELVKSARSGKSYLPEIFDYLLLLDAKEEAIMVVTEGVERGEYFMIHHLYKPFARDLRRDPRILEVAQSLGITTLWRETGKMPDFCDEIYQFYNCKETLAALALRDSVNPIEKG